MKNKTQTQSIVLVNKEINKELEDPNIVRALLATTFKGLGEQVMKQAIFEGVVRGFTFKDFLQKDVFALPYGQGYSLVTSIDFAQKRADSTGEFAGATDPEFGEDPDLPELPGGVYGKVTVFRLVKGQSCPFTSKVYLKEYSTGKNLWSTKPRTMLGKVARMHALRVAFPEQLAKVYTSEEFDKEKEEVYDTEGITDETVPTIHIGSSENETAPNMTIDKKPKQDDFVMPTEEKDQENLIKGLVMKKWPELDLKDKKGFKQQIADYTELEYTVGNYPAIINALR